MTRATFEAYARTRLNVAVFVPNFDKEDEQLFAASLASTENLFASLGERRNPSGAALLVSAGFVETITPNAFADWHEGGHVIGLHAALLVTITDFALYAFTQANFLPTIGDPAAETSPPPSFGEAPGLFLLDRTLQGGAIDVAADKHRVPNDAARHEAAIYLAVLMARFVWLHEWAHCALGHVDYLKAAGSSARLHEVPDPQTLVGLRTRSANEDTLIRHAMELEADNAALTMKLQFQLDGREPVPGIQAFDPMTRVEMSAIAALLMAWLFEEYQRHMDTRNAVTHPAPRDRLHTLYNAAEQILAGSDAKDRVLRSYEALRAYIKAMPALDGTFALSDTALLETALAPYRYVRG